MELKIYLQKLSNLTAENRLLKLALIVIGGAVVFSTLYTVSAVKNERTILVPAGLNGRVEVADGRASDSYLDLMTRYVVDLALNYTPATARKQFGELLSLYTSEAFPEAQKTFYALSGTVETANVSSAFSMDRIKVDRKRDAIEVTGVLRQFGSDGSPIGGAKEAAYELTYRIFDGRFMLTSFNEKGGNN